MPDSRANALHSARQEKTTNNANSKHIRQACKCFSWLYCFWNGSYNVVDFYMLIALSPSSSSSLPLIRRLCLFDGIFVSAAWQIYASTMPFLFLSLWHSLHPNQDVAHYYVDRELVDSSRTSFVLCCQLVRVHSFIDRRIRLLFMAKKRRRFWVHLLFQ